MTFDRVCGKLLTMKRDEELRLYQEALSIACHKFHNACPLVGERRFWKILDELAEIEKLKITVDFE